MLKPLGIVKPGVAVVGFPSHWLWESLSVSFPRTLSVALGAGSIPPLDVFPSTAGISLDSL